MPVVPTHAQLGATLRAAAASSRRLGDENRWRAAPGSEAAATWAAAANTKDPLQLTLTEADVKAVLLIRSALTHAEEVGRAIAGQRPILPHSLGRIAAEHALRALHLTDRSATPAERAERHLDDWLYAITEAERLQDGYAKKANLSPDERRGLTQQRAKAEERAAALGLPVTITRTGGSRVSARGRQSTMALAEAYLSGSFAGVPEFLIRAHSANIHGTETALLTSTADQVDQATGINVPTPVPQDPPTLAFTLMTVPMALDNAFRDVASRLGWPEAGRPWRTWSRDRGHLLETWRNAVDAAQEDDV